MKTVTTVWRISNELVQAIDEQFGDPVDSYVNGSQTWLLENGPGEMTLEWRLHPVPGYERPRGVETADVFRKAADGALDPVALWDGLEAFAAYDDDVEIDALTDAVTAALGMAPDAAGGVDHEAIGDEWEASDRTISIVDRLFSQLTMGR